jgi:hypothetical protein
MTPDFPFNEKQKLMLELNDLLRTVIPGGEDIVVVGPQIVELTRTVVGMGMPSLGLSVVDWAEEGRPADATDAQNAAWDSLIAEVTEINRSAG